MKPEVCHRWWSYVQQLLAEAGYDMKNNTGLRDGPLENLLGGGAGEVQKKNSRKGKLNEKKFMHAN